MLNLFRPKWKKEAIQFVKGLTRLLHYRKDLISVELFDELSSQRDALKKAIKAGDKEETEAIMGKLSLQSEGISPDKKNALAENVEVFFVAIVIALGIKTYFLQPFRIPTGSMQPSLNGIRALDFPADKQPNLLGKIKDFAVTGSLYYNEIANRDKKLISYEDASNALMTRTRVKFNDGSSFTVSAPPQTIQQFIRSKFNTPYPEFKANQPILQARLDTGDLVLVDKVSYHFRHPKRGEVFVFDTRDIEGITDRENQGRRKTKNSHLADQQGGQHYIKRLVGLPGDTLEIHEPNLVINGKIATEPGMRRVQERQAPYNSTGYTLASPHEGGTFRQYLGLNQTSFSLKKDPKNSNLNEYAAMGDNTINSLDSRYWGPVKEYNVVGPALISLWPFTAHWGLID